MNSPGVNTDWLRISSIPSKSESLIIRLTHVDNLFVHAHERDKDGVRLNRIQLNVCYITFKDIIKRIGYCT